MINSMTGFGSKEVELKPFGKICVELRSTNHKFLETVFHLPEGFLSAEDKIKKEIEVKIKRGRVTCSINIIGESPPGVFINKVLLKDYIRILKNIKEQFQVKDEVSINTLASLPGVLSIKENLIPAADIWPHLKIAIKCALDNLVKMRQKEGRALSSYLKKRAEALKRNVGFIKSRFKQATREKMKGMNTDEERSVFLKDRDISEETERLAFHIRNFQNKLSKNSPLGKELDFIAQEMQREANTIAAKSFDTAISARVVQTRSQIEKIREQVQNIE